MEAASLFQEAQEKRQANQLMSARFLLNTAKALDDHQKGLWAEYGALDSFNNPTQTVSDFKREIEQHPENLVAYERLSALYSNEEKWSEAEQTTQAWSKADPASPEPLASLGDLRMVQQEYKKAVTLFAAATAADSDTRIIMYDSGPIDCADREVTCRHLQSWGARVSLFREATMKRVSALMPLLALSSLCLAQSPKTWDGFVTDTHCGTACQRTSDMKPDRACVRLCVRQGSKYGLWVWQ
jgi:tetratricopeptide (TPR) repeat protein